jgi:hypothetical protein
VWDIALAVLFPGGFLRMVTPTGSKQGNKNSSLSWLPTRNSGDVNGAIPCPLANPPRVRKPDLVPLYAHPFDPAIPIGSLALAIVAEIDRRMATAARVAKAVRHG